MASAFRSSMVARAGKVSGSFVSRIPASSACFWRMSAARAGAAGSSEARKKGFRSRFRPTEIRPGRAPNSRTSETAAAQGSPLRRESRGVSKGIPSPDRHVSALSRYR